MKQPTSAARVVEAPARPAGPAPAADTPSELTVQGSPRGAVVLLDGGPLGTLPLSHALEAGTHTVSVQREGFASYSQEITLRPGASLAIQVALAAVPAPEEASAPTRLDAAPAEDWRPARLGSEDAGASALRDPFAAEAQGAATPSEKLADPFANP
ncbi:MAG: PEGA domain-containing protein [Deltaproteobacteria bacterium]|nr:PEGA domain-containing protein [Deltaproteobacteria bacterium]